MTSESETPGAAGTATEGEFETGQVPPIEWRIRLEWAHAAWGALDACAPQDRAVVLADHLARLETAGVVLSDLLGPLALSVRKRLFFALWETFNLQDRKRFIARIGGSA